jgi:hypothetical protein
LGRIIVAATTLNAGRWHAYIRHHPELAEADRDGSTAAVTTRDAYLAQAFESATVEGTESTESTDTSDRE